jgi:hypothetical protein
MGKVLFIDEAYVLAESPFGLEVLNTIVEQVQAKPGADRSVIMAGYPKEMNAMCRNVNPGLGRRFDSQSPVEFHDYSDESLREIMSGMAKKYHIMLLEGAKNFAISEIAKRRPAKDFGNAGTVNTFLDKAIKSAMTRCLESKCKWEELKKEEDNFLLATKCLYIVPGSPEIRIYGDMKYFTNYEKHLMIAEKVARKKKEDDMGKWQSAKVQFLQSMYREKLMYATQKVLESLTKRKKKLHSRLNKLAKKTPVLEKKKKAWDDAKAALTNHQKKNRREQRIKSWIKWKTEIINKCKNEKDEIKNLRTGVVNLLDFNTGEEDSAADSDTSSGDDEVEFTPVNFDITTSRYNGYCVRYNKLLEVFESLFESRLFSTILSTTTYKPEKHRRADGPMYMFQMRQMDSIAKQLDIWSSQIEQFQIDNIQDKLEDKATEEIDKQITINESPLQDDVENTKDDYLNTIHTILGKNKKNIKLEKLQQKTKQVLVYSGAATSTLKLLLHQVSLSDGTKSIKIKAINALTDALTPEQILPITKAIEEYNRHKLEKKPNPYKSDFQKLKDRLVVNTIPTDDDYVKLQLFRTLEEKKQLFLQWTPSQLVLTKFDFGKCVQPDPIEKLRERGADTGLVHYITSITEEFKVCQKIWPKDESKWPRASNIVFNGNSGTGKTESANMLGEAFKNAGLLVSGETTIRSASDLEGTVVGEAQKLVQASMEEALGGILLIDEAYELGRSEYGRQAQTKLIAMLEEEKFNNGKVVVILCGYQDKMQKMMRRNQGMASRFGKHFLFKDVAPYKAVKVILENLEEYFITPAVSLTSTTHETKSSPGTSECLLLFMNFLSKSENFGNYRDCKTISTDIKSEVYANIRDKGQINTAKAGRVQQKQDLQNKFKAIKEKATEDNYAEFYPTGSTASGALDETNAPEAFRFTVQNVIDVCKRIALTRIRKPKRSASYKQQQNHKEIVNHLEEITVLNFTEVFSKIDLRLCEWDMDNDTLSSVKYDIAHGEQIKAWLSLQESHEDRKEKFETKQAERRSNKNCTDTIHANNATLAAQKTNEESRESQEKSAREQARIEQKRMYDIKRMEHLQEHDNLLHQALARPRTASDDGRLNAQNDERSNVQTTDAENIESKTGCRSELRLVF